MTKKVFITATGTDVGKTYISALIVKKMREAKHNCGYYKPILSGCLREGGTLISSDANYVVKTAKIPTTADKCVSYWWEEAVSPHLAAKRQNQKININKIKNDFSQICDKYEYVLVEGAGGITCPLIIEDNNKYLLKDLIKDLNLSTLIVADAGLGTINSTLLTVEYAIANGININGIILNNYDSSNFMHLDNLQQVENLTDIKVVATITRNCNDMDIDINVLEKLFRS